MQLVKGTNIRAVEHGEMSAVDALRQPFYDVFTQTIVDPPGLSWWVAERDGKLGACVGLSENESCGERLVFDLLGDDAWCVADLQSWVEHQADIDGVHLISRMSTLNRHAKIAFRHGWQPIAIILRRPPQAVKGAA